MKYTGLCITATMITVLRLCHTQRKKKAGKLLLIKLRNSGNESRAGTPPKIILYKLLFSQLCHWISSI